MSNLFRWFMPKKAETKPSTPAERKPRYIYLNAEDRMDTRVAKAFQYAGINGGGPIVASVAYILTEYEQRHGPTTQQQTASQDARDG